MTYKYLGLVTQYDESTYKGLVISGGHLIPFHVTSFYRTPAKRLPRRHDVVELVTTVPRDQVGFHHECIHGVWLQPYRHWTMADAVRYVRHLQTPMMESGWCITLAGGVLSRDFGPDLDLILYPRSSNSVVMDAVKHFPDGGEFTEAGGVANVYRVVHLDRILEFAIPKVKGIKWKYMVLPGCSEDY